ncbi:MAG: hypothetical protein AUJ98_07635 [Bacteroidetes bacterium CG2_30_33_31]|nr:MAG: hypothetical protein AUJ98_07635 [Bacteroidetes bacterium CG2_30_33_31]
MTTVKIILAGHVQGVGFRQFILQKAIQLNINGFVKNQNDGSVIVEASGNQDNLELFIENCKNGPTRAIVSQFSIIDLPIKDYKLFEIR